MKKAQMKIAIVAPGSRLDEALAAGVKALAASLYPGAALELFFHPQCFLSAGHFAGPDEVRAKAFLEVANDPAVDAVWIGRGGYGACRIAPQVVGALAPAARAKIYLGYSDAGFLLAGLYRLGCRVAHGPMPADLKREGGAAAVERALRFLLEGGGGIEPAARRDKCAAFNLTILSALLGTALEPDLSGHVLMLEEVSEQLYRIDRSLFHVTSTPAMRRVKGLMLGRCSLIPPNDPEFGQSEEELARHWCAVSGIAYLGRADIGHDVGNKIVPFGAFDARS